MDNCKEKIDLDTIGTLRVKAGTLFVPKNSCKGGEGSYSVVFVHFYHCLLSPHPRRPRGR